MDHRLQHPIGSRSPVMVCSVHREQRPTKGSDLRNVSFEWLPKEIWIPGNTGECQTSIRFHRPAGGGWRGGPARGARLEPKQRLFSGFPRSIPLTFLAFFDRRSDCIARRSICLLALFCYPLFPLHINQHTNNMVGTCIVRLCEGFVARRAAAARETASFSSIVCFRASPCCCC